MQSIRLESIVPASPEECFALSLSVDAHAASMQGSGEHAIAGVTSGEMALGDTVTWQARHFGIPFTMSSQISEYDCPTRFVDEQVSGPFKVWRHEHLFVPTAEGTLMTDLVTFSSPAGPLGRAVDRLMLGKYMTALLERRNEWLVQELTA